MKPEPFPDDVPDGPDHPRRPWDPDEPEDPDDDDEEILSGRNAVYVCPFCGGKFAYNWGVCPRCGKALKMVYEES